MIDESIKTHLRSKPSQLDFEALISFMESTGIEYRDRRLRGPLGLTTYYCIYLDMEKLMTVHEKLMYFVILHETAHYKRIVKMGGKDGVIKVLSNEDFEEFFNHVIGEEIFSDRYACHVYHKLNKFNFPREATQQLHLEERQRQYKGNARQLFGVVQNNEENYKRLLESFVYEV